MCATEEEKKLREKVPSFLNVTSRAHALNNNACWVLSMETYVS
jgi:hypothetical protein